MSPDNDGQRFDRLPATAAERTVEGRATREEVIDYFADRFGIAPETFDGYTFWEKGAGKIWLYAGEAPTPIEIEAIGMTCLRTRQEHWKPTTDFAQRFGRRAGDCVIELDPVAARRFAAGEDQALEWDGDWGYLIAAHEVGVEPEGDGDPVDRGDLEPIGVGLYVHGELRSMVPKGRQRDLEP
jgi:NOL1/NOP2/fmu family ribosome biogenesis protein